MSSTPASNKVSPKVRHRPDALPVHAAPCSVPATETVDVPSGQCEIKKKLLKDKKPKLVRDSFTIPKLEYLILNQLKQRGSMLGVSVRKNDLIRAGIKVLADMPDAAFLDAIKSVPATRTEKLSKGGANASGGLT